MRLDRVTGKATMRLARRHTRRGFLGGLGKAAIVVAGASVVIGDGSHVAQALHECGHTGFSPNCVDDFCPDIFGRCWFAADCCGNGQIKKICDCCSFAYPNVHGYCPDGYNVRCIVTSCGRHPKDPRPELVRIVAPTADEVVASVARTLPGSSNSAVLVTPGFGSTFADALAGIGAAHLLSANIYTGAAPAGKDTWVFAPSDPADKRTGRRLPGRDAAERAAAFVYERARRASCIDAVVVQPGTTPAERWAALSAASAAAALNMACAVLERDPRPARSALIDAGTKRTILVGNVVSDGDATGFPGAQVVRVGSDPATASATVMRALLATGGSVAHEWGLVAASDSQVGPALATAGRLPVLATEAAGFVDPTYAMVEDYALQIDRMWAVGTSGAVSDNAYMAAEDALKGFRRGTYLPGYGEHLGPGD